MDPVNSKRHVPNGRDHTSIQPDLCRSNQLVPSQLESPNSGTMDHSDCVGGIPYPSYISSTPALPSIQSSSVLGGSCDNGGRDSVSPAEAGHLSNPYHHRGILLQYVPSSQEGWRSETSHKSETSKHTCEIRAFQDGGPTHSQGSPTEERLDGKGGPQGCLLHGSNSPQSRHLLLFKMGKKSFQFNCLPFGLCTTPRVLFTKLLKLAVEIFRSMGIRLVIYMDDMLLMANTEQQLTEYIQLTLFLLENLGFIINSKKSLLMPTQDIEFLGMSVNSLTMDLKLPGEKIRRIRVEANHLLS